MTVHDGTPPGLPVVLLDHIPFRVIVSVAGDPLEAQCVASPDAVGNAEAIGTILDMLFERAKTEVLIHYGG